MKKITLLLCCLLCFLGTLQAQKGQNSIPNKDPLSKQVGVTTQAKSPILVGSASFKNTKAIGTTIFNGPAGSATQAIKGKNLVATTITHSNTQSITPGEGLTCNTDNIANDNRFFRDFDLANDFGITTDFEVTDAEFGIETISGPFPITVNIYSTTDTFPGGTLTIQGSAIYNAVAADAGTVVSVPVSAVIPAGERLIYEIVITGDGITSFFLGANLDGQTGPSYIQAADCGAPTPTDLVELGFPDTSYVMNIVGDDGTIENCTSTDYDSTAVPFDIDGAETTTADCVNAPNEIPITVTKFGIIGETANFENVTIDIAHSFSGDLDISLVSPSGTELILANDLGAGTDDAYNGTIFEDDAADISGATAPFGMGPYAPEGGNFADTFDGESISGDWILKVCDDTGGDTGEVLQFSMSICIPPSNDGCEFAVALTCGDSITGETTNDTDSGGNPAPDEFFSYTGSGDAELVTISLCGTATDYNSFVRVYDSCDLTNEIIANDDSCGAQSEVSFYSDGTSTYLIMVEGADSESGNFSLEVTCETPVENDVCEDALPIACGETITGSTDGATVDSAPACSSVPITAPGVWYSFTDDSGLVTDYTISLCDSDYDTKVSVYTGTCGDLVCETANDDSCGSQSEATFQGDGNTTYYILVNGFGGAIGNYSLNVACLPVPPPNDMIANAIDVNEIGFPYTDPAVAMPAATIEGGTPTGCNINGANGVWYKFVSEEDSEVTATIDAPAGTSVVTFFEAPNENASETDLALVDQNTNQCLPGTSSTINTTAGQAYYLFVVNTGGITDILIDKTVLGADENIIEGFSYYPNPANDMLTLRASNNIENVAIYSILGRKVVDQTIGNISTELNISALSSGTYIMKVSINGEIGTYKIIKR